jgi:hypothetical protein
LLMRTSGSSLFIESLKRLLHLSARLGAGTAPSKLSAKVIWRFR